MKLSKRKRALIGPAAFLLAGGLLLAIGGRFALYEKLLSSQGERVVGTVTESGTTHSDGSDVNYIRYRFEDSDGDEHEGRGSGYRGTVGETILIEYVPAYPGVHRVAGAGNKPAYRYAWWILAAGALFSIVGSHWWIHIRNRQRLIDLLTRRGARGAGTVQRVNRSQKCVDYEFTAGDGSSHKGRSLPLADEVLKELDEGTVVTVLYDSGRPSRSVLEHEV